LERFEVSVADNYESAKNHGSAKQGSSAKTGGHGAEEGAFDLE
jgi:hypothetical protein